MLAVFSQMALQDFIRKVLNLQAVEVPSPPLSSSFPHCVRFDSCLRVLQARRAPRHDKFASQKAGGAA
jgi:hypothetical protein